MITSLEFIDQIRAIAQTGLHYTKDEYDRERYDKLLCLVSAAYSEITDMPIQIIIDRLRKDIGYATCKIGVQGALFDENGRILLEKRSDDGLWGLPSGWVDVGETPEITVEKEFIEETSLKVKAKNFLGYFCRKAGDFGDIHSSVLLLFYCQYESGQIVLSHECEDAGYFYIKDVYDWHKDHRVQAELAYLHWKKQPTHKCI